MATSNQIKLAFDALNIERPVPKSDPIESFTLFSALPAELRLKIWSFACATRVLPIRHHSSSTHTLTFHHQPDRSSKTVTRFSTTAAPPALLSVCAESRAQALTIYSLNFATKTSPGTIYFSPIHDTLYFPRYREMGYDETIRDFRQLVVVEDNGMGRRRLSRKAVEHTKIWDDVRSIALDYVDVNIKRPWESYNKACLIRSFPNLEEISLVTQPTKAPAGPVQRFVDVEQLSMRRRVNAQCVTFSPPKVSPEVLLRWWAGFRHSFGMEEKMMENASAVTGKPYELFRLPAIKLVTKCQA